MRNDLRDRLGDRRRLAVAAAVALLAGIAGPFGTFNSAGLAHRLLFWATIVAVALPLGLACRGAVERRLAGRAVWLRALAVCLAFAALFTPLLYGFVRLHLEADAEAPMNAAELGVAVLVVALLLNAVALALAAGRARPAAAAVAAAGLPIIRPEALPAPPAAPADPPPPRLAARLPAALQGEILHVTARDHYTVVRTDRGATEILLRFGDALAELDETGGVRVHRSHWVARQAVAGVARAGDRIELRLADGSLVPVSRRGRAALASLGLDPAGRSPPG